MKETKSIIVAGVGGQGTLLAGKLLGRMLTDCGFDVKVSEVHGMSQRGGSVVTYVRYGERVYSPTVEHGEADFLLSFELCEAARWCGMLKKGGVLVTNTQRIAPMPVITGAASYPEGILEKLKALSARVFALDALALAEQAGSARSANIALLGALSALSEIPETAWLSALEATVKPATLEVNRRAFALGRRQFEEEIR